MNERPYASYWEGALIRDPEIGSLAAEVILAALNLTTMA